jgi:argininosuccinate lyase
MLESKSGDVQEYVGSLQFDRRLYRHDIAGSMAHVRMLARQRILTEDEAARLVSGLQQVLDELDRGAFAFDPADEDIHMAIEARLFRFVGDVAGKLHTARSRNDQVALDVRMYVRDEIDILRVELRGLRRALVDLGQQNSGVIVPGYTHLQQAQPVLFAHHMLAYFEMFTRDDERLAACRDRVNILPLGSGALAGVPYPIDRASVASELGFDGVSRNSMDAVADRDFVAEFLFCCALVMMHISRLAEELILWSSAEFGFVTLGEGFTTGSSIMPQKRNPDVAELARGKSGRVYGDLLAMLTTLKGLPLTYNRDLQEDKVYLFDAVDTVRPTVRIFSQMLPTVAVHADRMHDAMKDYVLATDLADYLVRRGLPFREAHGIAARLSRYASNAGKPFGKLSLDEYRGFSPLFEADVLAITANSSVEARDVPGGTAPARVKTALEDARARLDGEASPVQ